MNVRVDPRMEMHVKVAESACDVLYICTLYFGTITKVNINTNYIDTSTWYLKYRYGTGTNTGTKLADSK